MPDDKPIYVLHDPDEIRQSWLDLAESLHLGACPACRGTGLVTP